MPRVIDLRTPANTNSLANTLAGSVSKLGSALLPDPASEARAQLMQAQAAQAAGSLSKDAAETQGLQINNDIAQKLMQNGIPVETDAEGRTHISAKSLPGLLAAATVLTKGSVDPSKWTDNTNSGVNSDLEFQRKKETAAQAAKDAITLQDNKPITANPGGATYPDKNALKADIAAHSAPASLASTVAGAPVAVGEGLPSKEETDKNGFPVVEADLPQPDPTPSSLAGTMSGAPAAAGPKYTPNSVTQPPKVTNISKVGSKPIPVKAADSIVMDTALLSQLEDLQGRLTLPKDVNDPKYAEVKANIDSFHPFLQSVPLVGRTITDATDPKGVPMRSALSNMANVQLHTLSGAAVTDPEWARLSQGIANVKDWNSPIAQAKLAEAIRYLKDTHIPSFAKFYSPENGYVKNTVLEPYYGGSAETPGAPATMREAVGRAVAPQGVPAPPVAGYQEGGYEFSGGNPSDPANWKKLP